METRDYYVLLGVDPATTARGIRDAYRHLALRYHPDRAGPQSTRFFQDVVDAYRVLSDPHVQIYTCGRRDIEAGLIDRRVLAVVEFLAASGLNPTVSGLACGANTSSKLVDSAGSSGSSVDLSKINGVAIKGHQGKGSITDVTIRRLLTLQGTFKPDEIISTMTYKGQTNTLSMPDHTNRIQVSYTPLFGSNKIDR